MQWIDAAGTPAGFEGESSLLLSESPGLAPTRLRETPPVHKGITSNEGVGGTHLMIFNYNNHFFF
jgi:hypothetical protein